MLEKLLKQIQMGNILRFNMFIGTDINELLDLRENSSFDIAWVKSFEELEKLDYLEREIRLIDKIREECYIQTYQLTNSSDISGYISDDFELISKAYCLNINNQWINTIALKYINNTFPCGEIYINEISIQEVFSRLLESQ